MAGSRHRSFFFNFPSGAFGWCYRVASPGTKGDWLSWLERCLHTAEVMGSSPVSPTLKPQVRAHLACGSSFRLRFWCAKSARLKKSVVRRAGARSAAGARFARRGKWNKGRGERPGARVAYVVKKARKQGGNAYLVRYHGPDGKMHSRQFPKKVDADRFAASTEVAKNDGSWIDPGGGRVLLSEWVEHWTPTQVHLRPSSRARDQTYLDTHILPRFGTLPISNIRNADIRAWVAELTAAGYAPATVAKAKQILSKILQAAVDDRRLPFNPG